MAHTTNIVVNGTSYPVIEFDHTAQEIDDSVEKTVTMVRPNLLDNWYFAGGGSQQGGGQFPINQRGQTSYNTQGQYGVDRWCLSNTSSVSIIDNGLSVIGTDVLSDDYIFERLENFNVHQTYTLSALFEDNTGTVKISTAFGESSQSTNAKGLVSVSFPFNADQVNQTNNFVRFHSSKTATLIAIKLELGPVQTLAHQDADGNWVLNDPPPNFQQELAKCQRYYLKTVSNQFFPGCMFGSTIGVFLIPTPVQMRTTPTFSLLSGAILRCYDNTETTITASNISVERCDATGIKIILFGIQGAKTGTASFADGILEFLADL